MDLRDIKRKARSDLHQAMRVRALYIATTGAEPVPVHVRVHTKFEEIGEISERDTGNAARHERIPSLIFWIEELISQGISAKPPNGAVISVEAGEAYKINNLMPPDLVTVTAQVTVLPPRDANGLPVPGDAEWPISMW